MEMRCYRSVLQRGSLLICYGVSPHRKKSMETISIKPTALLEAIANQVQDGQIGWSSADHTAVVNGILNALKDTTGAPVQLDESVRDVIQLACASDPVVKAQIVNRVLTKNGHQLDGRAADVLLALFNPNAFADGLAKNRNPKTGKPFIAKRSRKTRNAFEDLLDTGDTTEAAVAEYKDNAEGAAEKNNAA